MTHHHLVVHTSMGARTLDAEIAFTAPWTVLFGPSGSGKTTLLRAICGLVPESKTQLIRTAADGTQHLLDGDISLPPWMRSIAYAPQHAALFPHRSVRENVAFAGEAHRLSSTERAELVTDALRLFQLEALAERRPGQLSGGERQRVNLARAFAVPGCKLMLLDEPFTGVDLRARDTLLHAMQTFLQERAVPAISVTHSVEEALLLGAEVVRLAEGRVLATGPADIVLADERAAMLRALQ
jgi:molybdate transport system ATP-binding protein